MTTPTAARRAGTGFTRVELLVSVAVSAVVILGALALLTAQQRSFQATSGERTLQDGARLALDAVSTELRLAGWDALWLTGRAPHPVYLWIYNDQVELRPAAHLWGTLVGLTCALPARFRLQHA